MRFWLIGIVVALAGAGCAPRDGELRRRRLAAETRFLAESLDRLEDRLMVNQSRVRFWQEMRDRHEGVTALACASQERHAEEMARHEVSPGRVARRGPQIARWMPPEGPLSRKDAAPDESSPSAYGASRAE